jgi:polyisoprenoid-binding protein YceI
LKPTKHLSAAATLVMTSGTLLAATFDVDPAHSSVGFTVRHMMISNVVGKFDTFSGTYVLKDGRLVSLTGSIDTASVNTGIEKRDADLKSPNFFDAPKYPEITFKMTELDGDKVTGELTMHGVTRPVTLDAEVSGTIKDPWGNTRSSVSLSGKLNRRDFGLTYNQLLETGGVVVGDEVKLAVELEGVADNGTYK